MVKRAGEAVFNVAMRGVRRSIYTAAHYLPLRSRHVHFV